MTQILWAFLNRYVSVHMLGERVAYSWTCGDSTHTHAISCLWVWHKCTMELDPYRIKQRSEDYPGWSPTGVNAHELININPLHIEASVYWPACCGLHGWIRDGKWIDA